MAVDIPSLETKVAQLVGEGITRAASAFKADLSVAQTEIKERAAEIQALDAQIASLKTAQAANTVIMDGPASNLVREFGKGDDLALFPVSRSYSIGGKTHTEIGDGLLVSERTYGDGHLELKSLWEAGLVNLTLKKKDPYSMAQPELRRAFAEHNGPIVAKIADRVVRMGLANDRDAVIQRVFGVASGAGADLIPGEVLAPEMLRVAAAAIMDSPIGLFVQKQINDKNMKSPLGTARPRPYLQGVPSSSTVSDFLRSSMGTGVLAYTVRDIACAVQYDRNAEMDAIIAFMPELRTQMAEAMALALFDAILNGDTNATHQDSLAAWAPEGVFPVTAPSGGSSVGGDLDHRRAFLGLRARARDIGNTARYNTASTWTYAKIQAMQGQMTGASGLNNSRTAIFASFESILTRLSTMEQLATLDKFGPQATILTGQVASVGGKPVIRSWPLGRTGSQTGAFDTDGLHSATAGNNVKQSMVMVDLDKYHLGTRMGLRVENDVNIANGTGLLVASGRYAFESPDHSTALGAASVVNVVVSHDAT